MPQEQHRVSIKELRTHLSDYLAMAQQGQEVVVTNHGRAMVKLCPMKKQRVPGVLKGKITPQPADAWEFPADLAAIMEGEIEE